MYENSSSAFNRVQFIFLDRDGVLNRKPLEGSYVTRWEEFHLLPDVEPSIARLNRAGKSVIVVTNQRGIALGLYSREELQEMHARLQSLLAAQGAHLDAIYYCPHDKYECNCRKPLTGMFDQAFLDFPAATRENSIMVGDSLRDIEAGNRFGMRTVLLISPDQPPSPEQDRALKLAEFSVASLKEFTDKLLGPPQ